MAWFDETERATKIYKDEGEKGYWLPFEPPSETIACFVCGEIISWDKGVYWNGSVAVGGVGDEIESHSGYIFLHSECAKYLSVHLAKDALLCEKREHRYRAKRRD